VKLLLPLVIIGVLGLFVLDVISRRRSRALQGRIDDESQRAERELRNKDRRLGDWSAKSLEWARKATDASARAGRSLKDKLSGG
jgi:hypothetical protein